MCNLTGVVSTTGLTVQPLKDGMKNVKKYSPRRSQSLLAPLLLLTLASIPSVSNGQTFDERYSDWPVKLKVGGQVLIDNGLQDASSLERMFRSMAEGGQWIRLGGGPSVDQDPIASALQELMKKSVSDPDASADKDAEKEDDPEDEDVVEMRWEKSYDESTLLQSLKEADLVLLRPEESANAEATEKTIQLLLDNRDRLASFVDSGKTLIVDGALASCLGKSFLSPQGEVSQGCNLFLDCFIDREFPSPDETEYRTSIDTITERLEELPRTVGIGLESDCLLLLTGRKMVCFGPLELVKRLPNY